MKKVLIIILVVFVAINLAINIYQYLDAPKIGFVRSSELVYGYEGMKEMQKQFQSEMEGWKADYDALKNEYQRSVENYQDSYKSLSEEEKKIQEGILQQKQENISRYEYNIEEKAQAKEDEMLQGVLNQINTLVKDYGEQNHYTVIFGTTANGNILYGKEYVDITEDVLKVLNEQYN